MDILNINVDFKGIGNNLLYILYYVNIANDLKLNFNIDSTYFKILYDYKPVKGNIIEYKFIRKKKDKSNNTNIFYLYDFNIEIYKNILLKFNIHDFIIEKVNLFLNNNKDKFNENTVSVGIRTWIDKRYKINKKCKKRNALFNLDLYINKMKEFKNANFLIATDDINIYTKLQDIFGDKLFKYNKNNYNNDKDYFKNNLIEDFIELLLLSKNNTFIHTNLSTFYHISYLYSNNNQKLILI